MRDKLHILKLIIIINLVALGALFFISQRGRATDWYPVRGGITFGISGISLLEQHSNSLDLLIVHDNKQNQGRLGIISIKGKNKIEYLPLNWQSDRKLPIDLEAITSIPEKTKSNFIALSSSGKAYYIKLELSNNSISVLSEFNLPGIIKGSNFEAFGLQYIDGKLVAIWADRGEGKKSAKVYWGVLDLAKSQINLIGSANLKVPFPSGNVRHISDIKIDSVGIVYISSANDPGDDGPFQSAVYVAGYLGLYGDKIVWRQNPQFVPLYRSDTHKIEGIELIPGNEGGVIVGTDDENFGSYIYKMN